MNRHASGRRGLTVRVDQNRRSLQEKHSTDRPGDRTHATDGPESLAGQEPKYRREKEPACICDRRSLAPSSNATPVWQRLVEEHEFTGRRFGKRKTRLGWNQTLAPLDNTPVKPRWTGGWVRMNGEDRQVKLFCMRSRYSGKAFGIRGNGNPHSVGTAAYSRPRQPEDRREALKGKARVEQARFTRFGLLRPGARTPLGHLPILRTSAAVEMG